MAIYSPNFVKFAHNSKTALDVQDIEGNKFLSVYYCLLSIKFPQLRALGYWNTKKCVMDRIFYVCRRAGLVILY